MDAEADRGARTAPVAAAGQDNAPSSQADPELLAGASQPAAQRSRPGSGGAGRPRRG